MHIKVDQEIEFPKATLSLIKSSFETRSIKSRPTVAAASVPAGYLGERSPASFFFQSRVKLYPLIVKEVVDLTDKVELTN